VTSSVLEKTKEFLESAQTEETEKVEDDNGGKRDEGHEDDEEFLTADERSTEEEEEDFYDTREQEVSFENIQVCFLKQFLVGGNILFLFGHIVCDIVCFYKQKLVVFELYRRNEVFYFFPFNKTLSPITLIIDYLTDCDCFEKPKETSSADSSSGRARRISGNVKVLAPALPPLLKV